MAAVRQVANSIAKRVALPYRLDGSEVQVTAAIGLALYPDEARSAADLMRLADESMYRAKAEWSDRFDMLGAARPPARRCDDPSKRAVSI
jgi:GGDEF domain-containing protein